MYMSDVIPNHFKPYCIFFAAELKSIPVVQTIMSIEIAQAPPCRHAYKLRSIAVNGYVIVFNPIGERCFGHVNPILAERPQHLPHGQNTSCRPARRTIQCPYGSPNFPCTIEIFPHDASGLFPILNAHTKAMVGCWQVYWFESRSFEVSTGCAI